MSKQHTRKSKLPGSGRYKTTLKSGGTTYYGSGESPQDARQAAKVKADRDRR